MKTVKSVKYMLFIFIAGWIAFSCQQKEKQYTIANLDQQVIEDVLLQTIDSTMSDIDLDGKVLVHYDVYPDSIKLVSVQNVLKNFERDYSPKVAMLFDLKDIVMDSVKLDPIDAQQSNYQVIIGDEQVEEYTNGEMKNYFGQINLSPVIYSDDKNLGCFYFAYQCGPKCGKGYIIFFEKKEGHYQLSSVNLLWR